MDFKQLNSEMSPLNQAAMEEARKHWDYVAKPVGSLGLLEDAVTKLAGLTGGDLDLGKRLAVVFSADNGVLEEGVAMTPGAVTAIMTDFIANKRSSVCVMAKQAGADSICIDLGMFTEIDNPNLINRRIANGTQNMTKGPAMTKEQALQAIQTGMDVVKDAKEKGYKILVTGEMGIGNTTSSSAVSSVLLGKQPGDMTGRGVGLDDEGLNRKISAVTRAIEVNKPDPGDALDVLAKVGGFDIAAMCGMFLGGALYRVPVVVDGFISSTSALVAKRLCPQSEACMFASHLSAEPAAGFVMDALGLTPLVHASMRLGEGTGAVTLLPLLDLALAVYRDVMTYGDLGM